MCPAVTSIQRPRSDYGLEAASKPQISRPYVVAQAFGAVLAAAALYLIASGTEGFTVGGFASNGYGELSPAKYPLLSRWLQQERQGSAGMEQSGRVSSVLDRRRWSRTQREIMTEHHKIYAAMPQ